MKQRKYDTGIRKRWQGVKGLDGEYQPAAPRTQLSNVQLLLLKTLRTPALIPAPGVPQCRSRAAARKAVIHRALSGLTRYPAAGRRRVLAIGAANVSPVSAGVGFGVFSHGGGRHASAAAAVLVSAAGQPAVAASPGAAAAAGAPSCRRADARRRRGFPPTSSVGRGRPRGAASVSPRRPLWRRRRA